MYGLSGPVRPGPETEFLQRIAVLGSSQEVSKKLWFLHR
jgi:hypothetical protein